MNIVTFLVALAGALLGVVVTMLFLQWKVDRDYKTQLKADQEYAARLRKLRQPPPSMDERRDIFKEQLKQASPPARNYIGQPEREPRYNSELHLPEDQLQQNKSQL